MRYAEKARITYVWSSTDTLFKNHPRPAGRVDLRSSPDRSQWFVASERYLYFRASVISLTEWLVRSFAIVRTMHFSTVWCIVSRS